MEAERRAFPSTWYGKRATVVSLLLLCLLAPGLASVSRAEDRAEVPLPDLRTELLLMVDNLMTTEAPQIDEAAREALAAARSQLYSAPGGDLAELEALAPQVAKVNKAFELLGLVEDLRVRRVMKAAQGSDAGWTTKSGSFPEAAYPNLVGDIEQTADVLADTFSNPLPDCCLLTLLVDELADVLGVSSGALETALEVLTAGAIPLCGDGVSCDFSSSADTNSVTDLGQCDAINRSSTLEAFTTRTAFIIVEAARDVASRICSQSLGLVVAGGNVSVLCIPMDFVYIVAKSVHDNLMMCDDFIDAAEIDGSYERLDHLHGDLETAQSSVDDVDADLVDHAAALADHDARIADKIADNDAVVTSAIGASETAILSSIDTHDTDMKTLLAEHQAFFTQLEIEEALLNQESEATYYLPAAEGGNLELARAVVAATIANVTSSGEDVYEATGLLADADGLIAAGRYKKAFDTLGAAYFDAVKRDGETKPAISSLP